MIGPEVLVMVALLTLSEPTPALCLAPTPHGGGGIVRFNEAWARTMRWEGGPSVHTVPGDPGGTTKWGISQRAFPELNIPELDQLTAMEITENRYWDPVRADELPAELRWHVFDFGFNAGVGTSIKSLQMAVNLCRQAHGRDDFLHVDGVMGPKTLAGVDEQRPDRLVRVFKAYRIEHYMILAETGRAKFIHGWLRRAEGDTHG